MNPTDLNASIEGLFSAGEVFLGFMEYLKGGNNLEKYLFLENEQEFQALNILKKNQQVRSIKVIKQAHENINKFIKNGSFLC